MEKQSIYEFVYFGTCVRFLQDVPAGTPLHGETYVLGNLQYLFKYLDDLDLVVTRNAAYGVADYYKELTQLPEDTVLTIKQAKKLNALMHDVRKTLSAELHTLNAYRVTPKVLDVNKLVDDVSSLFGPKVFTMLPEIAQHDFSEAGKCIVFERPTAASFHLLRGTESVLRNFYERMVRQKRIRDRMWGPVVTDLRKRNTSSKYASLYNNLDNIRIHYRNPTQHPEKIYDMSEAQDLWSLCVEVTNRMMRILVDEKR
jgi:hypothetical protein